MPGKIVKKVIGEVGKLVKDTAAQAVKEPVVMFESVVGGGSGSKTGGSQKVGAGKASSGRGADFGELMKQDRLKSQREIERLRGELSGEKVKKGRDVEGEIEQVRRKKKHEKKEGEKEFLEQLRCQKAKEDEDARQESEEVMPAGKRPRGQSPWAQKGTRETGKRRAV